MPSVRVVYKDIAALRFLKLLSEYFGFKVVENIKDDVEPESQSDQFEKKPNQNFIPASDYNGFEPFLTSLNLDASVLLTNLWTRR